ncbi:hypothetical protein ACFXG4_08380 [Nocardia sp. NPDC059246]|uniref:DUF7257 domain-containing protein n=1 Tax=unclassified Nocardia TaxID=2637762 RepID=UPI00369EFA96
MQAPAAALVVTVSAGEAAAQMPPPTVTNEEPSTVPAMVATAAMPVPEAALIVSAPSASASGDAPTPQVVAAMVPGSGAATAAMPVPSVRLLVPVPPAGASAGAGVASLAMLVLPASASCSAAMPVPSVQEVVSVPAATASTAMPVPAAALIATAPAGSASASMPAPTLPPPKQSYSDDFNRTDASTLGSNWVTLGSNSPTIATNRAQSGSPGTNVSAAYAARYTSALASDTIEASIVTIAPTLGNTNQTGVYTGVIVRCNAAGTLWVEALIGYNNVLVLGTRDSAGTFTARPNSLNSGSTAEVSISTPTSLRLTANGTTYSAYVNGSTTPAWTWSDSGGVVAVGSSTRYVGVVCTAQNSFGNLFRSPWAADSWAGLDT